MDKYARIVQKLVSLSIKLVAVDFDLTILNVHTHGNWQFTAKSLASRVRPAFKQFLTAVLECDQLHVAVVTQSPQVSLVREVLEEILPQSNTGRIHIRGNDGTWRAVKGVSKEGKIRHAVCLDYFHCQSKQACQVYRPVSLDRSIVKDVSSCKI